MSKLFNEVRNIVRPQGIYFIRISIVNKLAKINLGTSLEHIRNPYLMVGISSVLFFHRNDRLVLVNEITAYVIVVELYFYCISDACAFTAAFLMNKALTADTTINMVINIKIYL